MSAVFFIDRSLGKHIFPDALRKRSLKVEAHDDHLPSNATDEEWLELVGHKGWVAVTKDRKIRYRSLEMQALISAGVRTFLLTGKNKSGEELANQFLKGINRINKTLAAHKGPFIAKVYSDGKVKMWFEK
jgi:predicted nuclease of predicted toxin-antitoxin system